MSYYKIVSKNNYILNEFISLLGTINLIFILLTYVRRVRRMLQRY